jgi:hypothetical protein
MKKTILFALMAGTLLFAACKKDKKEEPTPSNPVNPNESEVITTMKVYIKDSVTLLNIPGSPFIFKDPDGDGGTAGGFLPTTADSIISLSANTAYLAEIILLDETKTPVDSISNAVKQESAEHMFFYNNGDNTFSNSANPYIALLNGSGIRITYADLDSGSPQRGLGQKVWIRTAAATSGTQYPFKVTLRHQPGVKDGSFAPGETDVEVRYKVIVN